MTADELQAMMERDSKAAERLHQPLRENRAQTYDIEPKKEKQSIQRFNTSDSKEQEQKQKFDRYGFAIESKTNLAQTK